MSRHLLLIGASNQVSVSLLEQLLNDDREVTVCSRRRAPSRFATRMHWIEGGMGSDELDGVRPDDLVYLAPLNELPRIFERLEPQRSALIFSSTSARTKIDSSSAHERKIAEMLRRGEDALRDWGATLGIPTQVFRPTLIYGRGLDSNLSLMASLIARRKRFALPLGPLGYRQPVHADDLASAVRAALDHLPDGHATFELGGAEQLQYDTMVERIFDSLALPPQIHRLPAQGLETALKGLRLLPRFKGLDPALVARMHDDLVADNRAAESAFGYSARDFAPTQKTWEPRGL